MHERFGTQDLRKGQGPLGKCAAPLSSGQFRAPGSVLDNYYFLFYFCSVVLSLGNAQLPHL